MQLRATILFPSHSACKITFNLKFRSYDLLELSHEEVNAANRVLGLCKRTWVQNSTNGRKVIKSGGAEKN